ncbi:MAG: TetR/AcrR family transcriptional regulator [Actinomycetota bacterium]|nr:TetR/AcrR family transcriptional regulator [Actinomycetota bacterium]
MPEIGQPANERSRRTRQAVLSATRSILEDDGFEALTMGAVARRAGVSRRGVYLHFDSVAALIAGLFDHVAETEGLAESVDAVWRAPDAIAGLDAWAGHLASYHPRVMAVDRALQRIEQTDEAAAAHRTRVCNEQTSNCHRLARWLAADGGLADGWDVASATDLLYGLISSDMIGRLLDDRGWSQQRLADRLSLLLRSSLVRGDGP